MSSLPRAEHLIDCMSCRGGANGIARPALRYHDGTPHLDARMCEAASVQSQSIVRIGSPPSTRGDLARFPAAKNITKSP
jgi:hypothetical protein